MLKRNFAVLIVVAVVLGTGAYAWAQDTQSPSDAGAEQSDRPPEAGRQRTRAGHRLRAIHADVTFEARDGAFRTLQIDRGKLVEVSATSVTVERADGERVTRGVDDETRVRGAEEVTQLQEDGPTLVVAEGGTAVFVGQRKPDAPTS